MGPERKPKRCRAGGRFPSLHSISPLCQWDFLPPFSPRQTPQAHPSGLREVLFQRLSSLMQLNSTIQPMPQDRRNSPCPLVPGSRQMEPLPPLCAYKRQKGRRKPHNRDNCALKSSEQRWFPGGDGSERHRQRLWEP